MIGCKPRSGSVRGTAYGMLFYCTLFSGTFFPRLHIITLSKSARFSLYEKKIACRPKQ